MGFFFCSPSICRRFDEMSFRLNENPETTEALVNLQLYLNEVQYIFTLSLIAISQKCTIKECVFLRTSVFLQSNDVTIHKLQEEIDEAAERLQFLLDYAELESKLIPLSMLI